MRNVDTGKPAQVPCYRIIFYPLALENLKLLLRCIISYDCLLDPVMVEHVSRGKCDPYILRLRSISQSHYRLEYMLNYIKYGSFTCLCLIHNLEPTSLR